MEPIDHIELVDESIYPDETILENVLGESYHSYRKLLELFDRYGMVYEWRYYRDGKAWLCKVQKKKKTIVWISAWKGYMKATVYFPERDMERLGNLEIKEESKKRIISAKHVGRLVPCTFEIKNVDVLKDLETLMRYKISGK